MTKRNLKISITPEQPLDEVVIVLGNKGYIIDSRSKRKPSVVLTWEQGTFDIVNTEGWFEFDELFKDWKLTTLTKLKEME